MPNYTTLYINLFSHDLEMKTRERNRNNKRTEIEQFIWFIERIQTRVAFGWLSERSGEKTSSLRASSPFRGYREKYTESLLAG